MFQNDVNTLVLYPVENMIRLVQNIRDDPLSAVKISEAERTKELGTFANQPSIRSAAEIRSAYAKGALRCLKKTFMCTKSEKNTPMETVILENTLIKLGTLLVLGFGEAGINIINKTMSGTSAEVNAMIAGRHTECIVGHLRVSNFSIATEVLQAQVVKFVNQVAEIVHGVATEFHGAINRSDGETFLILWQATIEENLQEVLPKLADMAVVACAKVIGAIHRAPVLANYRNHPAFQQKLGSYYRVNLHCGLHAGWAIEGAVGSEYKIEMSYLSPNINVAVAMETLAPFYGVVLLLSEAAWQFCTPQMASECRLIDRVLVSGSKAPMDLYCVDLDWRLLQLEEPASHITALSRWKPKHRMVARQFLDSAKNEKWNIDIPQLFKEDLVVVEMRSSVTEEFLELFKMGYRNYSAGEWAVAWQFLARTCQLSYAHGGPGRALMRFMERPCGGLREAPQDWRGVHDLRETLQPAAFSSIPILAPPAGASLGSRLLMRPALPDAPDDPMWSDGDSTDVRVLEPAIRL